MMQIRAPVDNGAYAPRTHINDKLLGKGRA